MKDAALIVFQKKPEPGKVKTRLAKTIGEAKALEVYQFLLKHTHEQVAQLRVGVFIYFEQEIDPYFLSNGSYAAALQSKGDLGHKMKAAIEEVLADGYQKAIVIGSDCPGLDATVMQEAVSELSNHDLVIGPARDGGYYLIGMKEVHEALFEAIPWSTSSVLKTTLSEAQNMDLNVHLLKELADVDVYEDLGEDLKKMLDIP